MLNGLKGNRLINKDYYGETFYAESGRKSEQVKAMVNDEQGGI
jgi:hypothetical protein